MIRFHKDGVAETDLAYAAGVLDSDGCVTVTRTHQKGSAEKSYSYVVTACVGMKCDDVPNWFLANFGGAVRIIRRNGKWSEGASGVTFFPPTYRWEMYGRDAAGFFEAVLPYLKMKRARAEAAISLVRMHRKRGQFQRERGRKLTQEEMESRTKLANFIRSENHKSNERVAMTAKWGIN